MTRDLIEAVAAFCGWQLDGLTAWTDRTNTIRVVGIDGEITNDGLESMKAALRERGWSMTIDLYHDTTPCRVTAWNCCVPIRHEAPTEAEAFAKCIQQIRKEV